MFHIRMSAPSGACSRPPRASLVALACLGVLVAAAGPARAGMAAMDPAAAQLERDYMTFTIDHHAGGVELAELALATTENDTLIDLSEAIRATQSREIGELQGFLSDWYGVTADPTVPPMTVMDLERLSGLDGREFDVDYSRTFIMHHTEIINRSAELLAGVEHEALRDFALGVIETQSAEIPVFASVIAGTDGTGGGGGGGGGPTPIPLPPAVMMGAIGLAGAGLATWRQRRKQFAA